MARCLNLAEQPVWLAVGSTVGTFTVIEVTHVDDRLFEVEEVGPEADGKSADREVVPGHPRCFYETAKKSCRRSEEV